MFNLLILNVVIFGLLNISYVFELFCLRLVVLNEDVVCFMKIFSLFNVVWDFNFVKVNVNFDIVFFMMILL